MKVWVLGLLGVFYVTTAFGQEQNSGTGWTLYPPLTEDAVGFCETRLQFAEQQLAKELLDFEYTVQIAAKGVSLRNEAVTCKLTVNRGYNIDTQKQEN